MSKTRAELVDQCLTNLGILVPGQSTSAENIAKMDAIIDPAVAQLAAVDIYYVQDAGSEGPLNGSIEDEAFLPLADWIANKACPAFNLAADQKMATLAQMAEATLTTIAAPARTRRTLQVDPALRRYWPGTYRGGWW